MKKQAAQKKSRFPKSIFFIVLGALLFSAGISEALILGMDSAFWPAIIQTHVMVFYWLGMAMLLTWLIRLRMKAAYDTPMQEISAVTKKVASGDFTVRIKPLHDAEKADYLDVMIGDLNTMIGELGSIETLKTDFVSNVSHEIRTPLSVIQNYAYLLQTEMPEDTEKREYAETILRASKRLNTLVTNILRLNKLENQQVRATKVPFDLSAQLAECLLVFEPVWEEKGISVEPVIPDDVTVCSDRELLGIVWNNLLSNAFKFTEAGGTVGISLQASEEIATVTVRDTGCGIPPETIRHIFDKFYQGDTSHAAQGNGLGLAMVRRILDMTDGEIAVLSAPGEGSAFTVKLKINK